jgi:hypothetical protein
LPAPAPTAAIFAVRPSRPNTAATTSMSTFAANPLAAPMPATSAASTSVFAVNLPPVPPAPPAPPAPFAAFLSTFALNPAPAPSFPEPEPDPYPQLYPEGPFPVS